MHSKCFVLFLLSTLPKFLDARERPSIKTWHFFQATVVLHISPRVANLSWLENSALHQEQDEKAIVLPESISMSIVQPAKILPKPTCNILAQK